MTHSRWTIVAFLVPAWLLAPVVQAQVPPVDSSKIALIHRLLELSEATELTVQAIEEAMPSQRALNPQIPKEFWDEFAVRVRRETPQLLQMFVPIYDAKFTTVQLQELVAFYESPLGRHLLQVQPAILAETMQAGRQWGARMGGEIAAELARRGIRMPGS